MNHVGHTGVCLVHRPGGVTFRIGNGHNNYGLISFAAIDTCNMLSGRTQQSTRFKNYFFVTLFGGSHEKNCKYIWMSLESNLGAANRLCPLITPWLLEHWFGCLSIIFFLPYLGLNSVFAAQMAWLRFLIYKLFLRPYSVAWRERCCSRDSNPRQ